MSGISPDHQRREDADRIKRSAQVGIQDLIPLFSGKIVQLIAEASDSGVVDQNIETLESAVDPGGRVFKLMKFGDIAGNHLSFAARFQDRAGGLVQRGLGAAEQNGSGSHGSEFSGDGGANPAS